MKRKSSSSQTATVEASIRGNLKYTIRFSNDNFPEWWWWKKKLVMQDAWRF